MAYLHKVLKVGNTLGVCIPREYSNFKCITRGFYCVMEINAEGFLVLKFFDPEKRPDLLEHTESEINID